MMRNRQNWLKAVGVAVVVFGIAMMGAVRVSAKAPTGTVQQSTGSPQQPSTMADRNAAASAGDPNREKMQQKQVEAAENQRHRRMVADSEKLLQLATELKDEVDKTTKDEMSVTTIQKAAQIEKLAHDVKERMKGE